MHEAQRSLQFMGIDLIVPQDVLRPRPETETLAKWAVEHLSRAANSEPVVMDMCCGSGNIAIAIAMQMPACHVWAADLTEPAVSAARENVRLHQLSSRMTIRKGDLFAAFDGDSLEDRIDMIVCNPPYISTSRLAGISAGLLIEEPREAFDGGPFGLSIHQRLVRDALPYLKPGGVLLCEFGAGQDRQIESLVKRSKGYGPVVFAGDDSGVARVAMAQKLPENVAAQEGDR